MKKALFIAVVLMCVSFVTGCASLSRTEQTKLREFQSYGISSTEVEVKNPGTAGFLNLLPGFGNFYLAAGTDHSEQWLYGFLNLLSWPISVVWGIPQAAIDAGTINKKETVYYYTYDPIGKKELENRQNQQSGS